MANQRDIKNRISSIKNTKKITSTMEMVSTAKMKKVQVRLDRSKPYEIKVNEIIANLKSTGIATSDQPLLREPSETTRVLVLQITSNRGLCGSFNVNIIDNTLQFKKEQAAKGKEVLIYNVGKKGTGFMKFMKEPVYQTMPNPDDDFTFDDAALLGEELKELFLTGEVQEVYISYMKVLSSSSQKPEIIRLMPISAEEDGTEDHALSVNTEYIFEPDPARIFSYILPLYLKVKIFTCFLETSFSEQFARRVAMKNATDASTDMIKDLTITYNRARQAKITNEIAEIVGGASALE